MVVKQDNQVYWISSALLKEYKESDLTNFDKVLDNLDSEKMQKFNKKDFFASISLHNLNGKSLQTIFVTPEPNENSRDERYRSNYDRFEAIFIDKELLMIHKENSLYVKRLSFFNAACKETGDQPKLIQFKAV